MNAHWASCKSLITSKEADMLVAWAKKNCPPVQAVIGHGAAAKHDHDFRSSVVRWLPYANLDLYWLFRRVDEQMLNVNRDFFGYHLQHSSTEWQLTEYSADAGGRYNWHEDCSAVQRKPMDRKLSFCMQLSDPKDYEGGKFEMQGDKIPPTEYCDKGDAIFFRSALRHQVTPVTRGTRYSLVTWFHGPRA